MAQVMFKKGLLANLPSTYAEGTFYVTTDERGLYLDVDNSTRVRIGDFQEFATLDALKANANPSTSALYYIADINCLAKFNGTEYVQINLDTGMTSVEVIGTGNAVTMASYDPATRKLTLTKGATYATPAEVTSAINTKAGDLTYNGTTHETVKSYVDAKTSGIATDAALSELQGRVTQTETDIDALETKVGSKTVGAQIDEKITALDLANTYDAKGAAGTAESNAKGYTDGQISAVTELIEKNSEDIEANGEAIEGIKSTYATKVEAQAMADAKVASVTAGDASVTIGGTTTTPTVAAKISQDADNVIELAADGLKVVIPAAAEYTVVKDETAAEGYSATYHLTKDGVNVGAAINIPKDMVVQSGSVVVDPDGQAAGTYLKLVLANAENSEIFIPVGSLIEYVTSGSHTGDMIVIAIDEDHKVTATITDGTITAAKLTTEVQTALNKAHTHENANVLAGIGADDITNWNGAQAAAEATAKGYTDTEIGKLSTVYDAKGAAAQALTDAKTHANGLNTAMDTRVSAVEGKVTTLEGKMTTVEGKVASIESDHLKATDKTELQGKIDLKANATNVYAKTETYTQAEVDAAIVAAMTWGSF